MELDQLRRFHFLRAPVRGIWVRLADVWQDAVHGRPYEHASKRLLGEMMATVVLIANSIKHQGGVTLHAVGDGPIKTAFAECQAQSALRGIVRMNEDEPQAVHDDMTFKELMGNGRTALTMLFETGKSYQGLVDTSRELLEENIEHYFENSEQLNTTLALGVDEQAVTGCFVQRLPSEDLASDMTLAQDEAEWVRLVSLFRTLRADELSEKEIEPLLRSVFPNDSIQLGEPKSLRFECSCSRERCSNALQALSTDELNELADDDGGFQVTCEFCGCNYVFQPQEIALEPDRTE